MSTSGNTSAVRKKKWSTANSDGIFDPLAALIESGAKPLEQDGILSDYDLRHFQTVDRVPTLLDLSAKAVAKHLCFQTVEERYALIPEPVQKRILFWSFPTDERHICMYSSPSTSGSNGVTSGLSAQVPVVDTTSAFSEGLRLLESGSVEEGLQVGFHLTGIVRSLNVIEGERKPFNVSISFDRCKITAVKCNCDNKDIHWCQHVVALSIFRIRFPSRIKLRLPISETLYQMNRDQLQKFVQYLITEHHNEVLPTAQTLADEIMQPNSKINQICGAPDPTAGPSADLDHRWFIDESQVCFLVRSYLAQSSSMDQLHSLFSKVRDMLRCRDENGPRLLNLITEQFLTLPWPGSSRSLSASYHPPSLSEKCQQLWDQLGALWVCVVLNPYTDRKVKTRWHQMLQGWIAQPNCPPENSAATFGTSISRGTGSSSSGRNRSAFHRALDACQVSWDDPHLQRILYATPPAQLLLSSWDSRLPLYDIDGNALWHEHIPTACARVDSLKAHGYTDQAYRLAVAIVQSLKHWQMKNEDNKLSGLSEKKSRSNNEESPRGSGKHKRQPSPHPSASKRAKLAQLNEIATPTGNAAAIQPSSSEKTTEIPDLCQENMGPRRSSSSKLCDGWIGHPLDPINSLFDCLVAASDSIGPKKDSNVGCLSPSPVLEADRYLVLALEASLIALGQQRRLPSCVYTKQKSRKQEEMLIKKLEGLAVDHKLLPVIKTQAQLLLDGCSWSSLGREVSPDSMPMHTFAIFLFTVILPHDPDLAYNIGLKAMRLPMAHEETEELMLGHSSTWAIPFSPLETQQSRLASLLIVSAKDDVFRIRVVLEVIHAHLKSSSLVYHLAHEVYREATSQADGTAPRQNLLNSAFELGLQVLRMTVGSPSWSRREMVRWLVTCASTLSVDAVISVLHNWAQLFTPVEASGIVAQMIVSEPVALQLKLDATQKEELARAVHTLALQCASKTPPSCALHALTLCENDGSAFEAAYQIIVEASQNGFMPAQEIFTIARHMEHRGIGARAFKLALLGLANSHIGYSDDSSPLVNDVYWACALGHSVGKVELGQIVALVVKNVKCAVVLSDLLGQCFLRPLRLACPPGDTKQRRAHHKLFAFDKPPLKLLVDAAIAAYVNTTQYRLSHISPRHYGEFIDFLTKARETFALAQDGHYRFAQMVENMKAIYKGKKKLMVLVAERFG